MLATDRIHGGINQRAGTQVRIPSMWRLRHPSCRRLSDAGVCAAQMRSTSQKFFFGHESTKNVRVWFRAFVFSWQIAR
jgi:hypothetical protein